MVGCSLENTVNGKPVEADFVGRLTAVSNEQCHTCSLVGGKEIVVGRGIIGETQVFRAHVFARLLIKTRDIEIETSQTVFALCGKIERHAVSLHKGEVSIGVSSKPIERRWGRPYRSVSECCPQAICACSVSLSVIDCRRESIDEGRLSHRRKCGISIEEFTRFGETSSIARKAHGRKKGIFVRDEAVNDGDAACACQHFVVTLLKGHVA